MEPTLDNFMLNNYEPPAKSNRMWSIAERSNALPKVCRRTVRFNDEFSFRRNTTETRDPDHLAWLTSFYGNKK